MTHPNAVANGYGMEDSYRLGSLDFISTESYVHPADTSISTNGLTSILFSKQNGHSSNVTQIPPVGEGEIFVPNTPLIIAVIVSAVVTVIANVLIIICIIGVPKLRTSFNIYICSLAVADLLVGLVVLPLVVILLVNETWPLRCVHMYSFVYSGFLRLHHINVASMSLGL